MGYKNIIKTMMSKSQPFIIEVKTDNAGSSSNQFIIPTFGTGYNYTVRTSNGVTTGNTGDVTITWPTAGTYDIEISGNFPRIYFNFAGDRLKILKVKQWGSIIWTSMQSAFFGCSNLDITSTDVPNLSSVTSFAGIFQSCQSLINSNGSISNWNISNITNLFFCFSGCHLFNQPLSSWNTSNVTNMIALFQSCLSFDQDITMWDTSKVTTMSFMFNVAIVFNQQISNWNISKVTTMSYMFNNASLFNQDLSSWQLRLSGVDLLQIFGDSGMSTANYTDTIVGWANYTQTNSGTPINVNMMSQNSRTFQNSRPGVGFANAGVARLYLIGIGWSITSDTVIA